MIRSTNLSLKFSNKTKLDKLTIFLSEYRKALSFFVDLLWETDEYKFVSKEYTDKYKGNLNARATQCAAKQALAIVRGTWKKHEQRKWRRDRLFEEGKDTSKLDNLLSKPPTKPELKTSQAELDSRFVEIQIGNNSFDLWIKFNIGGKSFVLPVKKTKHINRLLKDGKLKNGCRLSDNGVTLAVEIEPKHNRKRKKLAIDIGVNSCLTTSSGQQINTCPHGHSLSSINKKLSRCKKGSKGFKRAQAHRKNFICWSVNQLNLNVGTLVLENIKHMRKGKNVGRLLSHFTYAEIFDRLELACERLNVSIVKVNPAYTSTTCPHCGEVNKKNRKGKIFRCIACGYTEDADHVGSLNILASL